MKKLNLTLLSTFVILLIFSSCKKEEIAVVKEELTQEKILDLINGPQTEEDLKKLDEYYGLTDAKLTREELEQRLGIDNNDGNQSQGNGSFRCPCNIGAISLSAGTNGFLLDDFSHNTGDNLIANVIRLDGPYPSTPFGTMNLQFSSCNTRLLLYLSGNLGIGEIVPGGIYRVDFYLHNNGGNCNANGYKYFVGE